MVAQRSSWIVGLLFVVLFGAAFVAWRWLRDDPAGDGSDGGAHSRAAPAAADELPAAQKAELPASATRDLESAPVVDDHELHELPAGTAFKNGVTLTVVRHEDGVPVAGAHVAVFDARHVEREELAPLLGDPAELQRRAAVLLCTDASGVVHVPRPVAWCYVVASTADRRGCRSVGATTYEAQQLDLYPPRAVDVRVVDEQGKPQRAIEVALAEGERSFLETPLHATTDAEGIARLADLELDPALQNTTRKFALGFAFPLLPPVSVAVELEPPPKEPVVLTLPATGAIAFHVVDATGAPLAVAGALQLSAAATVDALDARRRGRNGDVQAKSVVLDEKGHGTAPRVGLALQFRARPDLPERTAAPQQFVGPARAGEVLDVALPVDAIGPVVIGHAVGGGDASLAGAGLFASLDGFDASGKQIGSDRADATIAGDGTFRLDFRRSGLKGRECPLFLRATRAGGSAGEAKTTTTLPDKGVVDLGTVRFATAPLLASGVVVDDESEPLEEAAVRVEAKLDPPVPFKVNHLPSFTTTRDGTFELRGELPDGALSLRASRNGYLPMRPLAIVAGATDVTLTLRMGGSLAGSLRLPDGFPEDLLFARLRLPSAKPPLTEVQPVRADGLFRFPMVAAGLWDFELLLGRDPDDAESLEVVHEVVVHPAEQTRDPRLQEQELLSLVRIVAATVHVAGGAYAEKGAVGRASAGRNGKSELSVPLKEGRALVPCTSVPVDLQVAVPGFLAQTVRTLDGPLDVFMQRGLPVRFVVSGHNERQPGWIAVRVTARPKDDALAAVWPGEPVALAANEATLLLPAAGKYRARIEFAPPPDPNSATSSSASRRGRARSDVEFEVKEADREQVIELQVKR